MNLMEKIKVVVEGATGLVFHYDTARTLNNTLDKAKYPCVLSNILQSGTAIDNGGSVHERIELELRFADKSNVDFDGLKVEQTIDGLKKLAFRTLLKFYKSDLVRVLRVGNTERYYATEDVILCGFGLRIELEEIEGTTLCS